MVETDELLVERRGAAGILTLNRPKALNALTHAMVRAMRAALERFAADPAVTRVVVVGAGEKAFSAGGDIRALATQIRDGRHDETLAFWREEYELNVLIKRFPKPYVAVIDGIVMGGGAGVSINGSHVVASARFAFAMPEVGIGFFPDVGATYFLPRAPGHVGTYLALTGARVGQGDALANGLATHAVPEGGASALVEALQSMDTVDQTLAAIAPGPLKAPLSAKRALIDRCFGGETVNDVLGALDAEDDPFAAEAASAIRTKSPTSLTLALRQMRMGRALSFEQAMATEFRIVSRIARGHDFPEGVRAVILDKDGAPRWRPDRLENVDPAAIDAHFASLGADEFVAPRWREDGAAA